MKHLHVRARTKHEAIKEIKRQAKEAGMKNTDELVMTIYQSDMERVTGESSWIVTANVEES